MSVPLSAPDALSWDQVTDNDCVHLVEPWRYWRWRVTGGPLLAYCGRDVAQDGDAPDDSAITCVECVVADEGGER